MYTLFSFKLYALYGFHGEALFIFADENVYFGSDTPELCANFVGISEAVVPAMTYKLLTCHTLKILFCSNVRPTDSPVGPKLSADLPASI